MDGAMEAVSGLGIVINSINGLNILGQREEMFSHECRDRDTLYIQIRFKQWKFFCECKH